MSAPTLASLALSRAGERPGATGSTGARDGGRGDAFDRALSRELRDDPATRADRPSGRDAHRDRDDVGRDRVGGPDRTAARPRDRVGAGRERDGRAEGAEGTAGTRHPADPTTTDATGTSEGTVPEAPSGGVDSAAGLLAVLPLTPAALPSPPTADLVAGTATGEAAVAQPTATAPVTGGTVPALSMLSDVGLVYPAGPAGPAAPDVAPASRDAIAPSADAAPGTPGGVGGQVPEQPAVAGSGSAAPAQEARPPAPATAPGAVPTAPAPGDDTAAAGTDGAAARGTSADPAPRIAGEVLPTTAPAGAGTPTSLPVSTAAATATAAPAAAGSASAPSLADQLSQQLGTQLPTLRTLGTGRHVLSLAVDPEHLGPVRVIAHITPDAVRVELVGATDAARESLRQSLPDLRRDLVASGLPAEVNLGGKGQSAGQGGPGGQAGLPGDGGPGDGRPGSARQGPGTGPDGTTRTPPTTDGAARSLSSRAPGALDLLA